MKMGVGVEREAGWEQRGDDENDGGGSEEENRNKESA